MNKLMLKKQYMLYLKVRDVVPSIETIYNMPIALREAGCVLDGDYLYIFGGKLSEATQARTNKVDRLNVKTLEYESNIATIPLTIANFGIEKSDRKVYLISGAYSSSYPWNSNNIYIFDLDTFQFETLSGIIPNTNGYQGIQGMATALINNASIYIFGGSNANGRMTQIRKFDIASKTLTTLSATLPNAVTSIDACANGTDIYIFGGWISGDRLNTIWKFDTTTSTITTINTMPYKVSDYAIFKKGLKVYIIGGYNDNGFIKNIILYDIESNVSSTISLELSIAMGYMGFAYNKNECYSVGGDDSNGSLNIIQKI